MFQTIFPAQESRREQQAILEQQAEAAREAAHVSRSEGGPQVQRFQESWAFCHRFVTMEKVDLPWRMVVQTGLTMKNGALNMFWLWKMVL